MMVSVDPFLLAVGIVGVFSVGALAGGELARREARSRSICPTCLGPTNDRGTSEAWGGRRSVRPSYVETSTAPEGRAIVSLSDGSLWFVDELPEFSPGEPPEVRTEAERIDGGGE